MRIVTVVGARPQFVKASAVSPALRSQGIEEVLVHTGQHYDRELSAVFFSELGLAPPSHDLAVGSASHAAMTARIMERLEPVLAGASPRLVLVYGDTNSTVAAALTAAKLGLEVAHVEAGMRSFNRRMPEEVNRVVTDHLATLHFCATERAARNLAAEGVTEGVLVVGDVMADALRLHGAPGLAPFPPPSLASLGLEPGKYLVVTCHRAENTDDAGRLASIVAAVEQLSRELPVVFPVHPRTRARLEACGVRAGAGLHLCAPLSYREAIALIRDAAAVATDSGGVQKEAYLLACPCVTLRDETEWLETVEAGWNRLAGASTAAIVDALRLALETGKPRRRPELFGDGRAAERIAHRLAQEP